MVFCFIRLVSGCEPTYKELKWFSISSGSGICPCCEPTYKELKSDLTHLFALELYRCEPTYKELKYYLFWLECSVG